MAYAVDVITTKDREALVSSWRQAAEGLSCQLGFVSAELFEMKFDILNAFYNFVSVVEGSDAVCTPNAPYALPALHDVDRTLCHLETRIDGGPDDGVDHVWLVNPFEITSAQLPEVLEMWDKAKDHMVAKEGFIDARLFRARVDSARYGLINVACWKSADLLMGAINDMAYDRHRERSRRYSLHPSVCLRVAGIHATDAVTTHFFHPSQVEGAAI